jgi:hypothetical protein
LFFFTVLRGVFPASGADPSKACRRASTSCSEHGGTYVTCHQGGQYVIFLPSPTGQHDVQNVSPSSNLGASAVRTLVPSWSTLFRSVTLARYVNQDCHHRRPVRTSMLATVSPPNTQTGPYFVLIACLPLVARSETLVWAPPDVGGVCLRTKIGYLSFVIRVLSNHIAAATPNLLLQYSNFGRLPSSDLFAGSIFESNAGTGVQEGKKQQQTIKFRWQNLSGSTILQLEPRTESIVRWLRNTSCPTARSPTLIAGVTITMQYAAGMCISVIPRGGKST